MPSRTWSSLSATAAFGAAWLAAQPAQAAGPLDTDSIWTFQVENDAASTLRGTSDQYYTSGLRLGWTSGQDAVGPAASLGHNLWGGGTTRLSIDISQSLFTPRFTQLSVPLSTDRPYAAELLVSGGLIHDSDPAAPGLQSRELLSLTLGVIGPSALGEQVQNGFHNIIGDTPNRGWHYQLPDQPAFELLGQRTLRLPMVNLGPIETDILPSATIGIGDIRDYAQLGGTLRFGQGLASDYGSPRITPGLNGTDAYIATRPFAWYAFAGVDGQAVGYDVTLDGSTFRNGSRNVHRLWDVGEFEGGLAVLWHGLRFSYTQTWQTQEFKGAKAGLFNFGSLAVSAKF